MLWVLEGEITEENEDVMSKTSVIFTKPYMCFRDDQSVVLEGEITEENEDVMSETSAIFTKPYMTRAWCEMGKLLKK